jgi:hypothetical protein
VLLATAHLSLMPKEWYNTGWQAQSASNWVPGLPKYAIPQDEGKRILLALNSCNTAAL